MLEKLREKFTYTQTIVLSFALLTLIGAALLTLPIASSNGTMTPILNTIFTSTSAISGAGLVLYDTYTHWSLFGRIVILLLIQIGNLGFIVVISMFSLFLRKRIGIYERRVLMQSEGTLRLSGVVKLLKRIFFVTFITELIGAAIFHDIGMLNTSEQIDVNYLSTLNNQPCIIYMTKLLNLLIHQAHQLN